MSATTDVTPGQLQDHRQAVCWRCNWRGTSTLDRARVERERLAHECDPAAAAAFEAEIAQYRRHADEARRLREQPTAVLAVAQAASGSGGMTVWDALLELARRMDEMKEGLRT